MDNDILLAGVYVDPMYRVILKEDQKSRAKAVLCDVAIRMKGLALQGQEEDEEHVGGIHGDSVSTSLRDDETHESQETDDNVELDFERHPDIQEQSKR